MRILTMHIHTGFDALTERRALFANARWLAPTLVTLLTIAMTIAFTVSLADSL
jgi:hypothetical protein